MPFRNPARPEESAPRTHIAVSETIAATVFEVAQRCCEFPSLHLWHPAFRDCVMEGEGVGAVRTLDMGGTAVRERLDGVSEDGLGYSYTVLSHPLLPENTHAYYAVRPGDEEGTSVLEWIAAYHAPTGPLPPEAMAGLVRGLTQMGLTAAKVELEEGGGELWPEDEMTWPDNRRPEHSE